MTSETIQKTRVSEDSLLKFLTKHGVKMIRLAELTGIKDMAISSCFHHHKNNNGVPRHFNQEQVRKINDALPLLADRIRQSVLKYDRSRAKVNNRGAAYDKGLTEPMKAIGDLMNLTALCERVLGWSKKKKDGVLVTQSSKLYGHITEEEATAVNTELLSVAGVLSGLELELWRDGGSLLLGGASEAEPPVRTKEKGRIRRRRIAHDDQGSKPWADTRLPLAERTRLYKQQRPKGVLIFKANGGYAVADDDARLAHCLEPGIALDTQAENGNVIAYMTQQQYSSVIRSLLADGRSITFTNMYA